MKLRAGGYTFIEVMIVLAISTLLFFSAIIVFYGQQRQTSFSQAMEDANSKIQSYVTQIDSGNFLDIEGYSCSLTSSRPILTVSSGAAGSNESCTILGRAIHAQEGQGKIYVYTILADHNLNNPEPALTGDAADSNSWVLVDEYNLLYGAQVFSSRVSGIAGVDTMVGIYNSLSGGIPSSGGAATSLAMKAYGAPGDPKSARSKDCINENAGCTVIPNAVSWQICIATDDLSRSAELVVSVNASGVTTQINDRRCVS